MTARPPIPAHPRLGTRLAYRLQRVLRPRPGLRWLSARIEASGLVRPLFTSTEQLTNLDGYRVRVWDGVTERGSKCLVFVHLIAVPNNEPNAEFDRELAEQLPPGQVFDLRRIL